MTVTKPVATLTDINAEHECLTTLSRTAQQLLKFRLYNDTEGIWVCCDWCNMWRYLDKQKDPSVFFKRAFHCAEVKRKCNVGLEETSDQLFYEVKFCAGSLVWAKRPDGRKEKDWPWWPALVEDCPDAVSQYFTLDRSGTETIAYHVTYLDAYRTCSWVRSDLIKPFDPESKSLKMHSEIRAGKKQRILKEAIERAKTAATYGVVDRLENFSYIAHMARLKGVIETKKEPVDTIVNGMAREHGLDNTDSAEEETVVVKNEKGRGRARKRKVDTPENAVISKRAAPPQVSAAEGTRAPRPLKENESAEEFQVEITANSDPAMDVDSGYAYSGEAIETPKPAKTGKTTTKTKDTRRKLIESPTPESSSPDEAYESQMSVSGAELERAKSAEKKSLLASAAEDTKSSRKAKKKIVAEDSQMSSSEPIQAPKAKASRKKKTPREDSVVESLPENTPQDGASVPTSAVSDSVSDFAAPESAHLDRGDQAESSGSSTQSFGFTSTLPEASSDEPAFGSELESTANIGVFNERQPRAKETIEGENKPPKRAAFYQPKREQKPTDPMKKPASSKRREKVSRTAPPNSYSMSQPLPSRTRGKFAPPVRATPREDHYTIDDLERDLDEGNI